MIPFRRPELVIDTVAEVVKLARASAPAAAAPALDAAKKQAIVDEIRTRRIELAGRILRRLSLLP